MKPASTSRAQSNCSVFTSSALKQSKIGFKAGLPRYPVTLRVATEAVDRLQGLRFARIERIQSLDVSGWSQVEILFEVEEDALYSVLGFAGQAEVLEPASLRAQVIQQTEKIVRLYHATS